jgi:hypothetical protein
LNIFSSFEILELTFPRGWGVLVIPPTTFKKSSTPQEALGTENLRAVFLADPLGESAENYFDISSTIQSVQDSSFSHHWVTVSNPIQPAAVQALPTTGLILESEETGILDQAAVADTEALKVFEPDNTRGSPSNSKEVPPHVLLATLKSASLASLRSMLEVSKAQHDAIRTTEDLLARLESQAEEQPTRWPDTPRDEPLFVLPDKSAILRIYQWDVELIPPTKSRPRTICMCFLAMTCKILG